MIRSSKLADFLNKADESFHGSISSPMIQESLSPGTIKQRREKTPPEELGSEESKVDLSKMSLRRKAGRRQRIQIGHKCIARCNKHGCERKREVVVSVAA